MAYAAMQLILWVPWAHSEGRQIIQALYIPLADHYAALVAYEKYRDRMVWADFRIEKMRSWPQLRGRFREGEADLAFIVSPMAMDMFREQADFRWVSLMHRDGNALAVNEQLLGGASIPENKRERRPDDTAARLFVRARQQLGHASVTGVPSLLATHVVVLYKYLRDHNMTLGLGKDKGTRDVMAIEVPPAQSVDFLLREDRRGTPASFEQSLPWADVVESMQAGRVVWYSKDVLNWPNGHVECIAIARDQTIRDKPAALHEVIHFIHLAAREIERARLAGGQEMDEMVRMIRTHVPQHNAEAIVQSLRTDLNVINYTHLDVDKPGLQQIMDLAVDAGILKRPVDLDAFTDARFRTGISSRSDRDAGNLDMLRTRIEKLWSGRIHP
ncbi:MAG: ABC transporter substrate-binding protein [Magnetococcus sp. MYC-9]